MLKSVGAYGQTIYVRRKGYRDESGAYNEQVVFKVRGLDVLKREAYVTMFNLQGLDNSAAGNNHSILFLAGVNASDVQESDEIYFDDFMFNVNFVKSFIENDIRVLRYCFYQRLRRATVNDLSDLGL